VAWLEVCSERRRNAVDRRYDEIATASAAVAVSAIGVSVAFGVLGASMARKCYRSAFAWGFAGASFGLLAIAALALAGTNNQRPDPLAALDDQKRARLRRHREVNEEQEREREV
jgi:hypothetical protein